MSLSSLTSSGSNRPSVANATTAPSPESAAAQPAARGSRKPPGSTSNASKGTLARAASHKQTSALVNAPPARCSWRTHGLPGVLRARPGPFHRCRAPNWRTHHPGVPCVATLAPSRNSRTCSSSCASTSALRRPAAARLHVGSPQPLCVDRKVCRSQSSRDVVGVGERDLQSQLPRAEHPTPLRLEEGRVFQQVLEQWLCALVENNVVA